MIIKVCGITNNEDLFRIAGLKPDYLGFIFYPPSPRDVSKKIADLSLNLIPSEIKKVAVLVDETEENALLLAKKKGFDAIQLHGNESPDFCKRLKNTCRVIKTFRVKDHLPDQMNLYEGKCDLFLLDTATDKPGGSGKKFDHSVLEGYNLQTPYLLSGGIGEEDADYLLDLNQKGMAGVDINSRFELSPGVKEFLSIERFIKCLRQNSAG